MAHRGQSCLAGRTTINGLTDSETETSMDACTACSKYSRWVVAGTVDEETAACRAFRASLTAVWILESSLSTSWSIQAGSAPTAEGPGVLVSWWWAGSGADFEAFLARRGTDMVWSSGGPSDALTRLFLLVECVFGI